jgi:uncharacterized membrane protein
MTILMPFTFAQGYLVIGIGAWMGTIMAFNVWFIIWPNQQKILGMKKATAEEIATALMWLAKIHCFVILVLITRKLQRLK